MKNNFLKYILGFLILLYSHSQLLAIDIQSIGVPYVQNFPKSSYLSGNQNWSIAKDKNGLMYFGNVEGLLTFDGKYWQQYKMPNRQIVRAVATGSDGLIYTGSFGEFGFWSFEDKHLTYKSLINLIPKPYHITDEVWKIYVIGKKVIFQTFSTIYTYENKKISVVKASNPFLFVHLAGNKIFAEVLGKVLFELQGKNLIPLAGSEILGTTGILSILPYKNNSYLIGTSKNGLFIFDGIKFYPLASPANSFLKTFQLNNGVKILNKYYAYGTILNGLIIIDEDGVMLYKG